MCSASHCTGALRMGSVNVDSGRGAITGLPLAGRVNGPISHGCALCACNAAAQMSAAKANLQCNFIPNHPWLRDAAPSYPAAPVAFTP